MHFADWNKNTPSIYQNTVKLFKNALSRHFFSAGCLSAILASILVGKVSGVPFINDLRSSEFQESNFRKNRDCSAGTLNNSSMFSHYAIGQLNMQKSIVNIWRIKFTIIFEFFLWLQWSLSFKDIHWISTCLTDLIIPTMCSVCFCCLSQITIDYTQNVYF